MTPEERKARIERIKKIERIREIESQQSTVQSDVTKTPLFNPVKEENPSLPTRLAKAYLGLANRYGRGAVPLPPRATPKEMASDVGNLAEIGLPLMGMGVASIPLRILAAGALQGTGTMVKRGLTDITGQTKSDIPEMFREGAKSAALGTAAMAVPEVGIGLINKARAPFAKMVDANIVKLGEKYDVPLTASAVSKSRAVPLLESISGKGLFSNRIEQVIEQGGTRLNQVADKVTASFGKSTVPTEVGSAIEEGFRNTETTFRKVKSDLYNAINLKKANIPVNPVNTVKLLDETIEELSGIVGQKPQILRRLIKLRDGLGDPSGMVQKLKAQGFDDATIQKVMGQNPQNALTADKISSTIKDLNSQINFKNPDPIVKGYEGTLKRVTTTLNDELDTAIKTARPDVAQAIEKANNYYAQNVSKLNSEFGRKINKYIDDGKASEIAPVILNKTTPTEYIPQVFELVGQEGSKSLRASIFDKIISDARGGSGYLTQFGLERQMKNYGAEKLQTIFGKDITQKLLDISKLSQAWNKAQQVSQGSQTAFTGRILGEIGIMAANPLLAVKMILGDASFSKFIASPVGQKWMTTGFKTIPQSVSAPIAQTTRVVVKKAVEPDSKETK